MLLDQKRTKRMVQVVAVLTSIAFIGVIFVVVGFIVFGGGGSSSTQGGTGEAVALAQDRVDENPDDADAWAELALAHSLDGNTEAAVEAGQQAVSLNESDFGITQTLVQVQLTSGNNQGAIATLEEFTTANPENSEAFFTLGQVSDQAGQIDLARLSYQRYLELAPDGDFATDVQERLEGIADGEPFPSAAPTGGAGESHGGG